MIKVRILDCFEFCDGEAYVFVSEDVDARLAYPVYQRHIFLTKKPS